MECESREVSCSDLVFCSDGRSVFLPGSFWMNFQSSGNSECKPERSAV